jgi:hypothetical protein
MRSNHLFAIGRRFLWRASFVLVSLTVAYVAWCWSASHSGSMASVEERRHAWQHALRWVSDNESQLLENPNSALWWMLHHAAEVSNNPHLRSLVHRHIFILYGEGKDEHMPWRRMIDVDAQVSINQLPMDALLDMVPYQRDFLHATLCAPVHTPDQAVSGEFLQRNLCRPNLLHVVLRDKVCATHQLMALQVHRQSRCDGPQPSPALRAELIHDVQAQLFWFPWFEDADLQRVLMVYWQQGPSGVNPAWFNRVLKAQRTDGGWSGERQVVGAPAWLQPAAFRQGLDRLRGEPIRPLTSDFHASAQGVLLLALSLQHEHHGVWALTDE